MKIGLHLKLRMKLLGNTENKTTKDKNSENVKKKTFKKHLKTFNSEFDEIKVCFTD